MSPVLYFCGGVSFEKLAPLLKSASFEKPAPWGFASGDATGHQKNPWRLGQGFL
jgi:hypothetical protein